MHGTSSKIKFDLETLKKTFFSEDLAV